MTGTLTAGPLLSVNRLSVSIGGRALLREISFEVRTGERVGLIGESGSGKSLTALAVTGLLPRSATASGEVLLDGRPVIGASERSLRPLRGGVAAVVFQEPLTALDPLKRLGKQVAAPLARHQDLRGAALVETVLDALRAVRLRDPERIARSFPHQVSGGQRQRVALAMALACEPKLLIADEPTTALDVTVQAEILDLLGELVNSRGMALLLISHDLPAVAGVAERVVLLRDGEVAESAPIEEFVHRPVTDYARSLVANARVLEEHLSRAVTGNARSAS